MFECDFCWFNVSQLDYSLLAKLPAPASVPLLAAVERYFERPWIDHQASFVARYQHPVDNMPDYGRDMSNQIGIASLMLHLDFTDVQKETLLIRFTQLGIDLNGIAQAGGNKNWQDNGGHTAGRKWPILFAGLMLNDSEMKGIGAKSGDYLAANSDAADAIYFNEDMQTFYVSAADVYAVPYPRVDWNGFTFYGHGNVSKKMDYAEYTTHHIGMPEWGLQHTSDRRWDGLDWNVDYR